MHASGKLWIERVTPLPMGPVRRGGGARGCRVDPEDDGLLTSAVNFDSHIHIHDGKSTFNAADTSTRTL